MWWKKTVSVSFLHEQRYPSCKCLGKFSVKVVNWCEYSQASETTCAPSYVFKFMSKGEENV